MKGFKKLALVTAVAALPMSGFAMEALDDATLSGVTGQDGISVGITTNALNLGVIIHDTDGLAAISGDAGAIVIDNMSVNTGGNAITLDIDADGNGGVPVLNVAVSIPSGTTIATGDISVAVSDGINNAAGTTSLQTSAIIESANITLGATTLNIQLGNEVQTVGTFGTQMIALNTTITGGITIGDVLNTADNFTLNDANGGSISVGQIDVTGNGSADLGLSAGVNVDATDGLVISLATVGSASGLDVKMQRVALGGSQVAGPFLGDVEIVGLNLNGTVITVSGK